MGTRELRQLQLLLAVLVSSLMISQTSCVKNETLNTICSQTQNLETCVKILQSNPRTSTAPLTELSLISIDLTSSQASKNYGVFDKLIHNITDPALKSSYTKCMRIYNMTMFKLLEAYELAKQRRYSKIHQLEDAKSGAYMCENSIPMNGVTGGISEDMILTCETAASVNSYIQNYFPPVLG